MLLSVKWLKEFVPFQGTDQELADRLTMLGLEVEEVRHPARHAANAVVGRVLTCEPHPDADKLSLCTVDAGDGQALPVVCGAPNVAAGQTVAFAPVGAEVFGGMRLKKAKIRGQVSMGMICAEDELGLGEGHKGIMVLDPNLPLGMNLVDALDLDDVVLDVSVTPNRADCLSVLGMAREVAMVFGLPLTMPEVDIAESGDAEAAGRFHIAIDDPALCPVYQARLLDGVTVGPSPDRIRWRLHAVGQRPINNIVDVTNYVMFELGQPLHAFDRRTLAKDTIRVAPASEGMKFTTLDDQERALLSTDLLIWDGEKPVALAGVMGGANSEMADDSTRVLLESAVFHAPTIRKTARRLALPSESSYRFERGVDQPGSFFAMERAAALMAEFSGARVLPGVAKADPRPWQPRAVTFRKQRCVKLLGIPLEESFCEQVLTGMGCGVTKPADAPDGEWTVSVPSHRLDLEREVDLFEEIARVHGMDRLPSTLPGVAKSLDDVAHQDTTHAFLTRLKNWGRGVGLAEAINYSFVGQADLDQLHLPAQDRVPVKNPLSEDQDVLRTRLAPGLLQSMRNNLAQGTSRLRLFEVARIFLADADSESTARESQRLAILLHGPRTPDLWPTPRPEDVGYADLKGLVEHLLGSLGLPGADFVLDRDHAYLSPCVTVTLDGRTLGEMGRVDPEVADAYHARRDVWLCELDVDLLKERFEGQALEFRDLPKFPPVRRDLTVVAGRGVAAGDLVDAAATAGVKIVERVALADVYEPDSGDERNLTLRITYRHPSKTLKDSEVDKQHAKLVKAVLAGLPVRLQAE